MSDLVGDLIAGFPTLRLISACKLLDTKLCLILNTFYKLTVCMSVNMASGKHVRAMYTPLNPTFI